MKQILVMAVFVLFAASVSKAQDWSKEQMDVWQVVKDTWKAWQDGNASGVSVTLHEKYQGWNNDIPLPISKQENIDWFNSMKDKIKVPQYNIQPARIVVLKTAAVVHYYYEMTVSWAMGADVGTKQVKGKIAEFYVKEGEKWLLLGDMMVEAEDDDGED